MDFSKAFNTLNHDFLTAKPQADGFQHDALKLFHSYLLSHGREPKLTSLLVHERN